jgi:hypothetical protein
MLLSTSEHASFASILYRISYTDPYPLRQIIGLLFDSVGGSDIYTRKSAFDRALRDSET